MARRQVTDGAVRLAFAMLSQRGAIRERVDNSVVIQIVRAECLLERIAALVNNGDFIIWRVEKQSSVDPNMDEYTVHLRRVPPYAADRRRRTDLGSTAAARGGSLFF